jgi:hypothetical protein
MTNATTLELPLNLTIAALRKAGTGDSLLAALDVMVNTDNTDNTDVVTQEPTEWVNAVNLEDEVVPEETTIEL